MRIAHLGATGRTGSEFLQLALAGGHEIVAYVRRPEALDPRPGLTVVGGQLDDVETMKAALAGCDAVVTTLGPALTELRAPIMQTAIPAVIAAARSAGVTRVVVLSALGAGATYANTRYPYRFGCRTLLAGPFRDHVAGESQLEGTGLQWTTVHPGPLFNGPRTANPLIVDAASGRRMPGAPRTMRADVAAAMLGMLEDSRTFGKRMVMTSAVQAG